MDGAGGPADAVPGDAELVSRMRGGDTGAYEELYRRHADAVRRYVRHCCRDAATANDLTDEVFARTLLAVRGGAGPDTAVRTHLLAAVRDVAAAWTGTSGWDLLVEDFAVFAAAAESPGGGESFGSFGADAHVRAMCRAERSTAVRAFRDLPERWQVVLWHTVIEEEAPREVAPLLGVAEDAVVTLAQRAKEGLQQSYLTAHTAGARAAGGDCARRADRLGTYVRGGLRARADRGLRRHLERCAGCRSAALGARDVCERLRVMLPLAVVGWGADVYSPYPVVGSAQAYAAQVYGVQAYGVHGGVEEGCAAEAYPLVGPAGAVAPAASSGGLDGTAGGGAVFDGLGSTAKAGVTAGVMAAAVATALTLALVTDGQRPRGPYPGSGARPSAAGAPGGAETGAETGAGTGRSRAQTVLPREAADGGKGVPDREADPPGSLSGPEPGPGAPSAAGSAPAPGAGPGAGPGSGTPSAGSGPVPGGTDGPTSGPAPEPTSRPSAATVHRLDRLPRGGGSDGPYVREGSSWLWQRSELRVNGRDRGYGVTVSARSSVTVDLGGACTSFDALAGVDDLTALRGAVRFSVHGDGVRLWESGVVRRGEEPVPVHVPLAGVRTLRLVVEPNGVLDSAVMADWVQARFGCR
ncbi:hypothetical protein SUDANB106_02643 [Streptomyces sp. enrichment culture]